MIRKVRRLLVAVLLAGLALTLTLTATPSRADGPPAFLLMWGFGVDTGAAAFEICSVATVPCQVGISGSGDGQFSFPAGIAVDHDDYIYVADSGNNRIQKFNSDGTFLTKWALSTSPTDVAVDSTGNIYVVDTLNNRIQKLDSSGTLVTEWGSSGAGDGQFNQPTGVAIDSTGNVYVADQLNHRLQKFDSDGNFITKWGSAGSGDGQFNRPAGVAIDSLDNVYVTDSFNNRIQKFDYDGNFLTKWGTFGSENGQFVFPAGVAVDDSGDVYVTEKINPRLQKFDSNGSFLTTWGSPGSGTAMFNGPANVAIDSEDSVYVVEESNHRVQKFGQGLLILTKTVNDNTPSSGQRITYTISVDNGSTVTATNAVISDTLPDGLTFAGPVTLEGGSGVTGAPPILVSSLTITAGTRITVTLPATVNTGLAPNTTINNTASVTSTEVVTPQTGSTVITVNPVNLTLVKAVNTTFPNPGQRITYTITVNNSGVNNATGAVISDTLPAGLTFAGPVTLEGGTGVTGAPPILVSGLTITAGTSITVTLPVTVNTGQDSGTLIINTATVTSAEVMLPQSDPELIILLDTISPTFPITDLLTNSPLITPTLGVVLDTTRPVFEWYAAWDNGQVLTYILTLSSTLGSLPRLDSSDRITTTQTSFTPTFDLPDGAYTWTVQAQDAAGNRSESIIPQSFTIQTSSGLRKYYLPLIRKND